jgi:predicted dehydrogenase
MSGIADLRAAVIGTGFIGTVHVEELRRIGVQVAGVLGSTPERGASRAAALGVGHAYPSLEAILDDPSVDVVHVTSPNNLHVPQARAILAGGKHVVCEKPLATGAADAHRLVLAAETAGRIATVPFVYRLYPLVREARARVAARAIGDIRLLHGSYLQDWLATPDDDNWRVDATLAGASRAFADIGSHWCDLVEFVTGDRLAAVCAEARTSVPARDRRAVTTEDISVVLFRTRGGVAGSVVVSQVSHGRKNRLHFEVAGSEATLSFDQEQPETLWVGRRAATELVARDPAHLAPAAAPYAVLPPGHPQGYQDCFDAFVADTYRAIRAGGTGPVDGLPTFADGARAADITDAVLRSAAAGTWEEVPTS